MSSAFVKENEEQWLHEIIPTLPALIQYLTRGNNGVHVYERNSFFDKQLNKTVHVMSNGGSYTKDEENRWCMI